MNLTSFLKKLNVFGVLYGAKATKLSGIRDRSKVITDTITFTSPQTLTFTNPIPTWLLVGTQFRVTVGGGANLNQLFKVQSITGLTLMVAITTPVTAFGAGVTTIDARLATVINDTFVAKLNTEGDTIFNSSNSGTPSGNLPCDLGTVLAEHYHDDGGTGDGVFLEHFEVSEWFSTDAGDTYSRDFNHNLNVLFPNVIIWDDFESSQVMVHKIRVLDVNNLRISVTQRGVDARFAGTIRIEKT